MNPQVFGWQHLTYLAVMILLMIVGGVLIKLYAKSEKSKIITVKVIAGVLLALILWNRIAIAVSGKNWLRLIPDTFCGMSSLVLSLAVLIGKKDNNVLHFVFYIAFVGDILTIIYPDFVDQDPSFFYPNTISGLLHHTVGLFLCIVLLITNYFTPNYKKWPCLVIGFLSYITFGAFLMSVFGYGNVFYINEPILPDTPLTVWLLAVIFIAAYILFFVIYEYFKKKIATKKFKHGNNTDANGILEDKSIIIDENHDLNKENDKKINYKN